MVHTNEEMIQSIIEKLNTLGYQFLCTWNESKCYSEKCSQIDSNIAYFTKEANRRGKDIFQISVCFEDYTEESVSECETADNGFEFITFADNLEDALDKIKPLTIIETSCSDGTGNLVTEDTNTDEFHNGKFNDETYLNTRFSIHIKKNEEALEDKETNDKIIAYLND